MALICLINLMNFESVSVRNKTELKRAKNHRNWFRHFEDVRKNYGGLVVAPLFWPTLYTGKLTPNLYNMTVKAKKQP